MRSGTELGQFLRLYLLTFTDILKALNIAQLAIEFDINYGFC